MLCEWVDEPNEEQHIEEGRYGKIRWPGRKAEEVLAERGISFDRIARYIVSNEDAIVFFQTEGRPPDEPTRLGAYIDLGDERENRDIFVVVEPESEDEWVLLTAYRDPARRHDPTEDTTGDA